MHAHDYFAPGQRLCGNAQRDLTFASLGQYRVKRISQFETSSFPFMEWCDDFKYPRLSAGWALMQQLREH